jgi:Tfp pilus assembly protein PilF
MERRALVILGGFFGLGLLGFILLGLAGNKSKEKPGKELAAPRQPSIHAGSPAGSAKMVYGSAMAAYRTHDYMKALDLFKRVIELDAEHNYDRAPLMVAICYCATGRHPNAIEHFEKFLEKHPESAEAHEEYGISFYDQAFNSRPPEKPFLEKARKHLEKALSVEPTRFRTVLTLAQIYMEQGDFDRAEKMLKDAAAYHPDNIHVHRALLRLYDRTGDKEKYEEQLSVINRLGRKGPAKNHR